MYHTYTPDVEYALASIAADETRIVVTSNHSLTDGGFYEILIQDLQKPSSNNKFERKAPIPSVLRDNLLKKEFDEFLKSKVNIFTNGHHSTQMILHISMHKKYAVYQTVTI